MNYVNDLIWIFSRMKFVKPDEQEIHKTDIVVENPEKNPFYPNSKIIKARKKS